MRNVKHLFTGIKHEYVTSIDTHVQTGGGQHANVENDVPTIVRLWVRYSAILLLDHIKSWFQYEALRVRLIGRS